LKESRDLKDTYLSKEFESYFVGDNVVLNVEINDNLDMIFEISSKLEIEIFKELDKTFPEDDIIILKKIAKRRERLRTSLGPMYTKLGRKNRRKLA